MPVAVFTQPFLQSVWQVDLHAPEQDPVHGVEQFEEQLAEHPPVQVDLQ